MSSNVVDLSAFPVIRIDQIPYAESEVLQNAIFEVKKLVESMVSCQGPKPPLLSYLRRQLEVMHAELVERGAKERINILLSSVDMFTLKDSLIADCGDKFTGNVGLQSTTEVTSYISRNRLSNSKSTPELPRNLPSKLDISDISKPEKSNYNRTPLPSELIRKESLKQELHAVKSTASPNSTTDAYLNMKNSTLPATSLNALDDSKSQGVNDDETHSVYSRSDSICDTITKVGAANKGRRSSRRSSVMSNNNPVTGSPTQRATAALYKDFGTQFQVAATEKKVRNYPKKAVFETDDEIRERSKNDRCVLSL